MQQVKQRISKSPAGPSCLRRDIEDGFVSAASASKNYGFEGWLGAPDTW